MKSEEDCVHGCWKLYEELGECAAARTHHCRRRDDNVPLRGAAFNRKTTPIRATPSERREKRSSNIKQQIHLKSKTDNVKTGVMLWAQNPRTPSALPAPFVALPGRAVERCCRGDRVGSCLSVLIISVSCFVSDAPIGSFCCAVPASIECENRPASRAIIQMAS